MLFLFDEPTTGLHFDDIATLLSAFRQLVAAGHSVVVIEHNLDVIKASDWIIDLGPEGGEAGGKLVCAGTPKTVAAHESSHTAEAMRTSGLAGFKKLAAAAATRAGGNGKRKVARAGELRRSARSPTRGCRKRHRDPPRPRAQPQGHRSGHSSGRVQRDHRRERERKEHRGVRHPLCRGTAPLPGIPERLRSAVRPARAAPRRGWRVRRSSDGRHRAAHQPRRTEEHRGYADRGLPVPPPPLREARDPVLPGLQRPDPAPDRGGHPGPTAAGLPRQTADHPGPDGHRAQRLLYRSGGVGRGARVQTPAGGRTDGGYGAVAAPGPVPRAHHRAARGERPRISR